MQLSYIVQTITKMKMNVMGRLIAEYRRRETTFTFATRKFSARRYCMGCINLDVMGRYVVIVMAMDDTSICYQVRVK